MNKQFYINLAAVIFFNFFAQGQTAFEKLIKKGSSQFADAIVNENVNGLFPLLTMDAAILPEYHQMLTGSELITAYYREFFKKTKTLNFSKKPFEIQPIGDFYIELGNFEHRYITPNGTTFDYNGKYTTYWAISEKNQAEIIAHIWGASNYFEAENVDFINISAKSSEAMRSETEWEKKIEERRKIVYKAIFAGNAKEQLTSYLNDAVYMTYYDPPFIGKDKISDYFKAHYNPNFGMDSLQTKTIKVIDMGDYALNFQQYYVGWTDKNKEYFIKGKNLTLYKAMKTGPIMIYRQMVNHSTPQTPRENLDREKVKAILSVLDDQEISIEEQLKVYLENDLEHFPPGGRKITAITKLRTHLLESRASGTMEIKHKIENLSSFSDIVLMTGKTTGAFKPKNGDVFYPFETKNLFVFKRTKNDSLKISKVIWNMVTTETN